MRRRVALALAGMLLCACGDDEGAPEETAAPSPQAETTERVVQLTEGESLTILGAVHRGGAAYAAAAIDSVGNEQLRRLLRVMRADHQALQAEVGALADSLEVQLADSAGVQLVSHPEADRIRAAVQDATGALSGAAGGASDEAIVQRQIELQETLLSVLDSTVVPGTRQPLIARYVAAARPTLGAHLQRARQIEAELRARGSTAVAEGVRPAAPRPAAPVPAPAETARQAEPEPAPQADPEPTDPPPSPPDTVPELS